MPRHFGVRERVPSSRTERSDLPPEIEQILARLAEIDARYETDRESLALWSGPAAIRKRLMARLGERHDHDRQPLVQRLADLQREVTVSMMFGPPGRVH